MNKVWHNACKTLHCTSESSTLDAHFVIPERPPTGMAVVKKTFSTFGP